MEDENLHADIGRGNFLFKITEDLKKLFSLSRGTNLPADCRCKHNFWVCFWEKKSHSSKIGYVIYIKWKLWGKHILNFFASKKRI